MSKCLTDQCRSEAPQYHPGDRVWLATWDTLSLRDSKKHSPHYVGLYKIIRQVNPVTYRLELPRHSRILPSFHVSQLKPVISGPLAEAVPPAEPLALLDVDRVPAFTVSKVLKSCHRESQPEYLVDWERYGPK